MDLLGSSNNDGLDWAAHQLTIHAKLEGALAIVKRDNVRRRKAMPRATLTRQDRHKKAAASFKALNALADTAFAGESSAHAKVPVTVVDRSATQSDARSFEELRGELAAMKQNQMVSAERTRHEAVEVSTLHAELAKAQQAVNEERNKQRTAQNATSAAQARADAAHAELNTVQQSHKELVQQLRSAHQAYEELMGKTVSIQRTLGII